MSANQTQVGGNHYQTKAIQPWDYILANNLGFLEGCIIKYISRYKERGGKEDLLKAQHFLTKLIEVQPKTVAPAAVASVAPVVVPRRRGRPPKAKKV